MGNDNSIGKMARDPRVLGIPSAVSVLHSAERRTAEACDKSARGSQLDTAQLEDVGHNHSCLSVIDSRKLSNVIRGASKSKIHSNIRRAGFAVLAIWCISSTTIAIATYSTVIELEQLIQRMNAEVQMAAEDLAAAHEKIDSTKVASSYSDVQ